MESIDRYLEEWLEDEEEVWGCRVMKLPTVTDEVCLL